MAMHWRGVELADYETQFITERVCVQHGMVLIDGPGDAMTCPSGHLVESSWKGSDDPDGETGWTTVRVPKGHKGRLVIVPPSTKGGNMQGRKASGSTLDSQAFHTLGGKRMTISLERAKVSPFIVRVRYKATEGKSEAGILDQAIAEESARQAFARRVKAAADKGWRIGGFPKTRGLTDIPDPADNSNARSEDPGPHVVDTGSARRHPARVGKGAIRR